MPRMVGGMRAPPPATPAHPARPNFTENLCRNTAHGRGWRARASLSTPAANSNACRPASTPTMPWCRWVTANDPWISSLVGDAWWPRSWSGAVAWTSIRCSAYVALMQGPYHSVSLQDGWRLVWSESGYHLNEVRSSSPGAAHCMGDAHRRDSSCGAAAAAPPHNPPKPPGTTVRTHAFCRRSTSMPASQPAWP